jgi:cell wall-associated NlpC family hydrolase
MPGRARHLRAVVRAVPLMAVDPRITPARSDIAAKRLQGLVEAERFVEGEIRQVIEAQAPLRRTRAPDAPLDTEALRGERVIIYEDDGEGWSWGELQADGYVGYLPQQALGPAGPDPTHRVAALRTFIFPGPSIKLPPLMALSFGSRVAVERFDSSFAWLAAGGGCIPAQHLAQAGSVEPDFVAVAEKFLGVPYLWGGKTSLGLDCSGLVQVALTAAGIACPRDSDMQEHALGSPIDDPGEARTYRRGDLLFWKGHVAIVRDEKTLLHANAHHMAVAIEPTIEAIHRIAQTGSMLTSARRIARA